MIDWSNKNENFESLRKISRKYREIEVKFDKVWKKFLKRNLLGFSKKNLKFWVKSEIHEKKKRWLQKVEESKQKEEFQQRLKNWSGTNEKQWCGDFNKIFVELRCTVETNKMKITQT